MRRRITHSLILVLGKATATGLFGYLIGDGAEPFVEPRGYLWIIRRAMPALSSPTNILSGRSIVRRGLQIKLASQV